MKKGKERKEKKRKAKVERKLEKSPSSLARVGGSITGVAARPYSPFYP